VIIENIKNNSVSFRENPWGKVKKSKKSDSLVLAVERSLDLGEFISYERSWDFVRDLEDVKQ